MEQLFSDEYFMAKALEEARQAYDLDEIPIGCVVVCNNKIIARTHNLTEQLNDVTAHAEMQAITAAANHLGGKYLTECTLYVTVEPCPMCAGALNWAQISRVVWGTNDEKRGFTTFNQNLLHPKTVVKNGVLENESANLMKSFFADKRK
jgi:tRNA(adenine34) deaminase